MNAAVLRPPRVTWPQLPAQDRAEMAAPVSMSSLLWQLHFAFFRQQAIVPGESLRDWAASDARGANEKNMTRQAAMTQRTGGDFRFRLSIPALLP